MRCPCSKCKNKKKKQKSQVWKDLYKNGFVPNYTRWIYHGERDRIREEVVRSLLEECDADAGMADMMADYHEGRFAEGVEVEDDPEETAKAFYTMLESAQKPLHEKTMVTSGPRCRERTSLLPRSSLHQKFHCLLLLLLLYLFQ